MFSHLAALILFFPNETRQGSFRYSTDEILLLYREYIDIFLILIELYEDKLLMTKYLGSHIWTLALNYF